MGFKPAPGIKGRVFIPEESSTVAKKHACPDCYQCQLCSDDRCQLCRNDRQGLPPQKIDADICGDRDGKQQPLPEACHRQG